MIGKIQAKPIPILRLSLKSPAISPTSPGPIEPPKSPAIASNANMAVPPVGNFFVEILIVPGHMIPTEKPHTIQPISPSIELVDSEASR